MNLQVLAEKLNLSRATISRALRNDERISALTRQRVQSAADEAGYRQNPYVSVLMSKLRHGVSPLASPVIAYINPQPSRDVWRGSEHWLYTFRGAAERAKELGFELQEFWLREPGMTNDRLNKILQTRNIRAVILAPPMPGQKVDFLPENCATVACDIEPAGEHLHRVSTDYIGNTLKVLRALRDLGYRKIGLAMEEARAGYMHMLPRMALLEFEESLPKADRAGYWIGSVNGFREFAKWMGSSRPDAIVTANWIPQMWLQPLGFRIPEDIAVAQLEPVFFPFQYSGIDGRYEQVGRSAVDLLVTQIHSNEFSLTAHPNHVLNAGVWRPGVTAPPRAFAQSGSAYDATRVEILRAAALKDFSELRVVRKNLCEKIWTKPFALPLGSRKESWRSISLAGVSNAHWECPHSPALKTSATPLPTTVGNFQYHGVPFELNHSADSKKFTSLLLRGSRTSPEERPVRLAINLNVKAVYIFHLAFFAWNRIPAGDYRLHFESGRTETVVLRPFFPPSEEASQATFQDSWSPYPQFESSSAKPVFLDDPELIDQGRFAYVLEIKNSNERDRLTAMEFIPNPQSDTMILVAGMSALLI